MYKYYDEKKLKTTCVLIDHFSHLTVHKIIVYKLCNILLYIIIVRKQSVLLYYILRDHFVWKTDANIVCQYATSFSVKR